MKIAQINKSLYIGMITIALCFGLAMFMHGNVYAADPVLFFSDLDSGPKTGWEGSTLKGAAVTIWGSNFGASRGSNYVTVNGNQLVTDADYAEWDVASPARGLERITFWINSNSADGPGTISVTVNGVTSNTLPFTVRSGNIYFISESDGNNTYNGRYSTRTAHTGSDGPWKDLSRISPSNNTTLVPGDTIYVRGGIYTQLDDQQMFIHQRSGSSGTVGMPYAAVGYPTETVTVDGTSATRGFNYQEGAPANYWTFSKFNFVNGYTAYSAIGNYTRLIGSSFQNMLSSAWSGVIWVSDAQYTYIYGNYWNDSGYDKYKHLIYAKTQPFLCSGSSPGTDVPVQYLYIGWNEFSNFVSSDNYGGSVFLSKSSDTCVSSLDTKYIYIHDNYFHGGVGDFIYTGDGVKNVSDIYIYNNIFSGGSVSGHGVVYFELGTGPNIALYNNTFYQTGSGADSIVNISNQGTSSVTCNLTNNIFYSLSNQTFLKGGGSSGTLNSSFDLYYNPGGATVLPSGSGITVINARTGNPLFTNPTSGNFILQIGSPGIDAGSSLVNSIVTTDYAGNIRPWNLVYDIGAYEYVGGGTPPVTHTVTPSASNNGSIYPSSAYAVVEGTTTQLTVIPNSGYVAAVNGTCGGNLSRTTYTTNAITADCTVSASFSLITHTVTPSAGAHGTITPSSPQTVNDASTALFTVNPDSGYTASVGGTCGGYLSGTTYTTNTITSDCTVSATFVLGTKVPSTPNGAGLTL